MLQNQHLKIGNPLICPAAVIVRDNQILLGLRNYTPDKWKKISVWTMPGGRCESDETIEVTLKREVEEETGITDLKIDDFVGEVTGAKEGDIVPIFLCATNQKPELMEPEKFSEWKWVPINEYLTGEIWSLMNPGAHKLIGKFLTDSKMV
jgi:8-oxo-dGTP pyrophosphatase MutT (NUDIX family)